MSTPKLSVLITGSNQGLGFKTARQLSMYSHVHLFISGRNPQRVQEALEKILKEEGCEAIIDRVVIDVSDDDSIKAAVKVVETNVGSAGLDVLVVSYILPLGRQNSLWIFRTILVSLKTPRSLRVASAQSSRRFSPSTSLVQHSLRTHSSFCSRNRNLVQEL